MSRSTYLAYTEDVQRGRVERPHEEVLRPQWLHDHRLPRPRQVGHRVIPPHRVAEAPGPPVHPRVHPVEIPGKNECVQTSNGIRILCTFFMCNKIDSIDGLGLHKYILYVLKGLS